MPDQNTELKSKIEKHLNHLSDAIQWVETTQNLSDSQRINSYGELVENRRKLKHFRYTLSNRPAAVIYGESQQGKSYLVNSFLSKPGSPFVVVDQENGREYNFLSDINPRGNGSESTSLVTRYTTSPVSSIPGYPIKINLLTVTDIVLVLCDSYYNDIEKYKSFLSIEDINQEISEFKNSITVEKKLYSILCEDDVLDIRDYLIDQLPLKSSKIRETNYFQEIAKNIEYARLEEVVKIISVLWNKNSYFTKLFKKLLEQCEKINYESEVYAPYKTILHVERFNGGELLDVLRLKQDLYNDNITESVDIKCVNSEENVRIRVADLCALASEVVLSLPIELEKDKPFLKNTDILDFPGARSRLEKVEGEIEEDKNMPEMLLRGKVAYFFNKYSEYKMISTLLLCHADEQVGQQLVPKLLKRWIDTWGPKPEERQSYIDMVKISPLFVICTKFNKDMAYDVINDKQDRCPDCLNARWKKRFVVNYAELFGTENGWLDNWTTNNKYFDNMYLLRGFAHSSETESNLFRGWTNEGGKEKEEVFVSGWDTFRSELRESFINYQYVRNHFANPTKAWDEAATLNKDGSEFIIENMTIAANNVTTARTTKFQEELNRIVEDIVRNLSNLHHGDQSDEINKFRKKSGTLQLAISLLAGKDSYFFGKLMQEIMLSESDVYNTYHFELQSSRIVDAQGLPATCLIQQQVQNVGGNTNNIQAIADAYGLSVEELEEVLKEHKVELPVEADLDDRQDIKRVSEILVEALQYYYFNTYLSKVKETAVCQQLESSFDDMKDVYIKLYDKLHVSDQIVKTISPYVDTTEVSCENESLIADISTEIFNKFLTTVGYDLYGQKVIGEMASKDNIKNFKIDSNKCIEEPLTPTLNDVTSVFEHIDNLTIKDLKDEQMIKYFPGYRQREMWCNRMKLGFAYASDIPNYNVQENNRLGEIIQDHQLIKY